MRLNLPTFILAHLRQTWFRRFFSNFFTFTVLFLSFVVLNVGLLISNNFGKLASNWGDKIEMNLYLKNEADRHEVEKLIGQNPLVAAVKYISSVDAMNDLEKQLGALGSDLMRDPLLAAAIPSSFQFEFRFDRAQLGLEPLRMFADFLRADPRVADVQYGEGVLREFESVVNVAGRLGSAGLVVLLIGALFMVLFVTRNSVHQRRDEIEILELVGASAAMIRIPIVIEGILFSLVAGIASLVLTYFAFIQARASLQSVPILSYVAHELEYLRDQQLAWLILSYVLIGAIAAWICIRQLNSGFAAADRLLQGQE